MAKSKEPINPFYVLSGVLGVAFTVTACAYGVLMLQSNRGLLQPDSAEPQHPLLSLLDGHGMTILTVEVALLGIASVAAIVLDHFRGKRTNRENRDPQKVTTVTADPNPTPDP